jgi:Zn-finger protein
MMVDSEAHCAYFSNTSCEYYPCHGIEGQNCLFCFCPLYTLECGGSYTRTAKGFKDCSACGIVHEKDGYDFVMKKLMDLEFVYQ